jgi:2-oxoglutarate dehydrogenase E1 component
MKDYSFIYNADPSYVDSIYKEYLNNPESVDSSWQTFFSGFEFARNYSENGYSASHPVQTDQIQKELALLALIQAFRSRGHLLSDTNPIRKRKDRKPFLDLADYHLENTDPGMRFASGKAIGLENAELSVIYNKLKSIYCQRIGFEYVHIESREKRIWLQEKIENRNLDADYGLTTESKKRILDKLNGAVIFEKFLHTKYVGQKRFSLEGGESAIPALDAIIESTANEGTEEVVAGMAHRGRLNVLANIMGKTYEQIFNEFEGNAIPDLSFGSGDVKYHLGFSSQIKTSTGKIVQLKLAPNPSHLEAVDPVVTGLARAKADLLYQSDYDKILPILIHGDSAIAGQGVVYEIIQMSQLPGYYTGGTIHLIINNQIGFTTDFDDARSSTYSSAVGSVVQTPVFHVNGDDPEAVVFVAHLASQFRQKFNSDVIIDMVCYRRHGHNEGDDPKFTQPEMYEIISHHPNVREIYVNTLHSRGDVQSLLAEEMEREFWNHLQERLNMVKENPLPYVYQDPEIAWKNLHKISVAEDFIKSPESGIAVDKAKQLLKKLLETPESFSVLPKIKRLFSSWSELIDKEQMDWSLAELLSYSSILSEGNNVRMSGQDVKRGTFSHRHAILFDEKTNKEYNRLSNISENQGQFLIYNSLLSEYAVLGFEYGYSLASPQHLVLWEAQFGDFTNGAQVVIDQFITTAQSKWNRMSGLVMLLPHGYDGQGPEHSSARLERFLQSCAELNIVVINPSTPANFFHALRRQLLWKFRKPLIVMSPKSLLRHPKCISTLAEIKSGTSFNEVIGDQPFNKKKVKILLFCSGQVYYDLKSKQEELKSENHLIIRIEQLYPFPTNQIESIIIKHPTAISKWIQEEPFNMGAAAFIKENWKWNSIEIISRPASASTAVGFKKIHDQQLKELLTNAFN